MNIRAYQQEDKNQIITLLQLNTPEYFAPEEEEDLINYLDNEIDLYYVMETDHKIVGCGGINFEENKSIGKISWDILHPEYQGKSFGTHLMQHRLNVLKSMGSIQKITVRTSQVAYIFYEKQGFRLTEIVNDYWAKGFDLYHMQYNLNK